MIVSEFIRRLRVSSQSCLNALRYFREAWAQRDYFTFCTGKDKIALLTIPLSTQRHQAIFHGGIKPAGYREPTPSVCKKCTKSLKSKGSLTRHLKSCKGRKIKSRYWPSLCQRRDTRPVITAELNHPVTLSLRRPYARYVQNHTNTNVP